MPKIVTASLCNNYSRKQDWFPYCVGTWKKNLCPGVEKFFISDGTLSIEQQHEIETLSGGLFLNISTFDEKLAQIFESYPFIANQRKSCIFYRRIIDFSLYFEDYDYVLSLDTDIGLLSQIQLTSDLPDFAFCVDEVPGYSASPKIVFKSKVVTGLNAGFLLFRPKTILKNLGFLEEITRLYISKGKIPWWSEQTLWASIAANLCSKVQIFSSNSVAIISGFEKRSIDDIRSNKTRYFSRGKKIHSIEHIKTIIGDAPVVHFAGPGKPWIQPIMSNMTVKSDAPEQQRAHTLLFEPLPLFPIQAKFMLFLRLLAQQFR